MQGVSETSSILGGQKFSFLILPPCSRNLFVASATSAEVTFLFLAFGGFRPFVLKFMSGPRCLEKKLIINSVKVDGGRGSPVGESSQPRE